MLSNGERAWLGLLFEAKAPYFWPLLIFFNRAAHLCIWYRCIYDSTFWLYFFSFLYYAIKLTSNYCWFFSSCWLGSLFNIGTFETDISFAGNLLLLPEFSYLYSSFSNSSYIDYFLEAFRPFYFMLFSFFPCNCIISLRAPDTY